MWNVRVDQKWLRHRTTPHVSVVVWRLNVTQAKQISLLLLHHFYPVISYRRVQTRKKATNCCIYTVTRYGPQSGCKGFSFGREVRTPRRVLRNWSRRDNERHDWRSKPHNNSRGNWDDGTVVEPFGRVANARSGKCFLVGRVPCTFDVEHAITRMTQATSYVNARTEGRSRLQTRNQRFCVGYLSAVRANSLCRHRA